LANARPGLKQAGSGPASLGLHELMYVDGSGGWVQCVAGRVGCGWAEAWEEERYLRPGSRRGGRDLGSGSRRGHAAARVPLGLPKGFIIVALMPTPRSAASASPRSRPTGRLGCCSPPDDSAPGTVHWREEWRRCRWRLKEREDQ
jgi:hypothetical protein